MDDEAALLARRVALAASAWFNAPADFEAYRRLTVAVGEWDAYRDPVIGVAAETDPVEAEVELLDELVDVDAPRPLGEGVAALGEHLRRQARQAL